MTKQSFLKQLREALEEEGVSEKIIEETIQEYGSMIDDAIEDKETLESFIQRMGSPKKVAKALAKDRPKRSNRLTALSPFVATILFFLVGVLFQAWHPGWLFFLLIPITGILSSKTIEWRALSIFVILILFILLGTTFNLWNPLWSLFLLILPYSKSKKNKLLNNLALVYTYLAVAIYHLIIIYLRFGDGGISEGLRTFLELLSIAIFIPLVFLALKNGSIQINLDWSMMVTLKNFWVNFVFIVLVVVGYIVLGVWSGLWHPGWLIFLVIPFVYALDSKKFSITGLMPFIATILFVLVGEYAAIPGQNSAYALSWLFFLLIPISGILEKR